MAKDPTIYISNWQDGISKSRYTGFEDIRCCNLEEDGVLKINYKPLAMTEVSNAISVLIRKIAYGRSSASAFNRYAIGNSKLAYYHVTNGWTNIAVGTLPGTIDEAVAFGGSNATKEFLLFTNSTNLSALDCSDNAIEQANMKTDLEATDNKTYSPMFLASNNRVYIGNGHYLAELYETAGDTFDPTDSASYQWDTKKLDLPGSYRISCIDELGDYIVVGVKNPYEPKVSKVLLWDKSSPSYEQPIIINEPGGINQVVVHKGILFIQAGKRGNWYYSLGQVAYKCAELPKSLVPTNWEFAIYPNARDVQDDKIYFGLGVVTSSTGLNGIFSFDTRIVGAKTSNGAPYIQQCKFEYPISTGETSNANIGALISLGSGIQYSWEDATGSTYGIDTVGANVGNDTYVLSSSEAYVISRWFNIGDKNNKRTIRKTELQLAKALDTNETVKVYYRTERDGSWTLYHTMSTGQSDVGKVLTGLERIQWKIVLDAAASATTGPELLSFSFTPN